MPQKARPGEKTILQALSELAGYEDIRTSEDLGKLSESEIFSEWVLPAVTGASAETDEYQPGALDLALTIPVVGGSLKTGFKLAKEAAKRVGSAYRRAVRPKVFPQKDELLRESAESIEPLSLEDIFVTGENMGDAIRRMNEFGGYDVVQQRLSRARGGPLTGLSSEEIAQNTRSQLSELTQRLDEIQTQRPATQSTRGVSEAAEEFFREHPNLRLDISQLADNPEGSFARRRPPQTLIGTVESNVDEILNEVRSNMGRITRDQAQAIIDDIGFEGWEHHSRELRALPSSERELLHKNFMAKYREAGVIIGEKAAGRYKSPNYKFSTGLGEEKLKWTNSRRGTEHTLEKSDWGFGNQRYELKIKRIKKPGDPKYSLSGNPQATLKFSIKKITDDTLGEVSQISGISFFTSGGKRGQMYAGRLMDDLLKKMPENTVIDETSMTFDSFYMMLNQTIKHKASIIFDEGHRISIDASSKGFWSKQVRGASTDKERAQAIDKVMQDTRAMINKAFSVEGSPKLRVEGEDLRINRIRVHNVMGAVAVALGFKNKEQLEKLISHDPKSVEAQIFDNEFSL